MKKLLRAKRGEGYVDMCVGVVVFVMILVMLKTRDFDTTFTF